MSVASGHRTTVGEGDTQIPVVVVRGTPYEMGWHLGRLTRDEMQKFIPTAMARLKPALGVSDQAIQDAWARTAAYSDDRFEQELLGLSDGSGVPLSTLQAIHTIPLLMPYSCSSIAAWGKATEDGHLYQTRNLDWKLAVGAHDFPVVVVYLPTRGIPHVVPTFSGVIGAHTGMNVRGIVLSEMGDSPAKDAPYDVHAPHFTVFFRSLLYDADSLGRALEIFQGPPAHETLPLRVRRRAGRASGRQDPGAHDRNRPIVGWSSGKTTIPTMSSPLACWSRLCTTTKEGERFRCSSVITVR